MSVFELQGSERVGWNRHTLLCRAHGGARGGRYDRGRSEAGSEKLGLSGTYPVEALR